MSKLCENCGNELGTFSDHKFNKKLLCDDCLQKDKDFKKKKKSLRLSDVDNSKLLKILDYREGNNKWEYLVLEVFSGSTSVDETKTSDLLNEFGNAGWELVALQGSDGWRGWAYLKRMK